MAIGVFDSGVGGLTVHRTLVSRFPRADFVYLADQANAPYGGRPGEEIVALTKVGVLRLFEAGCDLVVLACNTASAKALRTIQQKDLPRIDPSRRVLGVIRPTTEVVGNYSQTGAVGIFATQGTVNSQSYRIEIDKFFPRLRVFQEACPIWVPLIENNELDNPGADYFVRRHVEKLFAQSSDIDTIILGCTHYPLLQQKIAQYLPRPVALLSQGSIVATSLVDYLKRHAEIADSCSRGGRLHFLTTDSPENFDRHASLFFGQTLRSGHLAL